MYIVSYLEGLVNRQTRMRTLKFSLIAGLLLGWLALWDLGLIHRRDPVGVVLQVLVMVAGVVVMWLWIRYWERVTGWLDLPAPDCERTRSGRP